jgi:protein-S-isoprenylcysteine O-methyltransferase Ste14
LIQFLHATSRINIELNSWGKTAQKIRVPAGTLLGAIFLLFMHPSIPSLWIGGIIAFSGAFLRLWAAGHIEKGISLTRGGPYSLTRNPLYLGSFIMAIGVFIGGQAYWLLPFFGLFFLGLYYPVMRAEEQELLRGHGEKFLEYIRSVPMFFPGFPGSPDGTSTFSWSRAIKNREHRTLAGLVLIEAFLIARLML